MHQFLYSTLTECFLANLNVDHKPLYSRAEEEEGGKTPKHTKSPPRDTQFHHYNLFLEEEY